MTQESRLLTPDLRYCQDATFAALVDVLEAAIRSCDYTPTEIREAAMLAAIRHEYYQTRQIMRGDRPLPACTCKHREREHEPDCYHYLSREENDLRMRMNLQGLGLVSLQDKEKPVDK